MDEDERCCGTGTCMINAEGLCWCGQQWNGSTLCGPAVAGASTPTHHEPEADTAPEDTP